MDDYFKRPLSSYCHVNNGFEGNAFVGIKSDENGVKINFPYGYNLPEKDDDLRYEIRTFLSVLAYFKKTI